MLKDIGTPQGSNTIQTNSPKTTNGLSYDMKTLVVILLPIFLYPIGVILMYAWMKWAVWVKALVTLPLVLILLVFGISFLWGLSSTVSPAIQIRKGQCTAQCETAVDKTACIQTCLNSSTITPTLTP